MFQYSHESRNMTITYTKRMQKQVAAFGVYAGLQDQNIASAHRVINQIYDFIHETIMIAPHI